MMDQRNLFASVAREERHQKRRRVLSRGVTAFLSLALIFIAIYAGVEFDNRNIRLDTGQSIGGTSINIPRIASLAGPKKMRLSDSNSVQLTFAPPETLQILQYETSRFEGEREFIVMTPIPSVSLENAFGPERTTVVEARIEAANMDIRPLQPAIQGFHQEAIIWDWNIRPREVGAQTVNGRLDIYWMPSTSDEEITERFLVGRFEFKIRVVETYLIPTPYLTPIAVFSLILGVVGTVSVFYRRNIFTTVKGKIPEQSIPTSGVYQNIQNITEKLPQTPPTNRAQNWAALFPTLSEKPTALMPEALPPGLAKRLNDALLRSAAFDSDADLLRTLFTDARLAPWRNHIPDNTPTRAARVNALIHTLYDKANATGDNALVLLLYVLADHTNSADALHGSLRALAADLERTQNRFAQS